MSKCVYCECESGKMLEGEIGFYCADARLCRDRLYATLKATTNNIINTCTKPDTVEDLTERLCKLLKADVYEYDLDLSKLNKENTQASTARNVCYQLLGASQACGMGGCSLCQS